MKGHSSSSQDTHHLSLPGLWPGSWMETVCGVRMPICLLLGCRSSRPPEASFGKDLWCGNLCLANKAELFGWSHAINHGLLNSLLEQQPSEAASPLTHSTPTWSSYTSSRSSSGSRAVTPTAVSGRVQGQVQISNKEEYLKVGTKGRGINGHKVEFSCPTIWKCLEAWDWFSNCGLYSVRNNCTSKYKENFGYHLCQVIPEKKEQWVLRGNAGISTKRLLAQRRLDTQHATVISNF